MRFVTTYQVSIRIKDREQKFQGHKIYKGQKIRLTVVFIAHTYITMSMPTQKQDKHTTWNIMPLSVAQEKKNGQKHVSL